MFVDARTIPENTLLEADVCIVGAGAAGITLAKEFIAARFRVCLLESGGFDFDPSTQALYDGENAGVIIPLNAMRLRYFGGSTNHWGNYCRPLEEIDFETRSWIPHSGWPYNKNRLDLYYKRAQLLCQLGPYEYDARAWEAKAGPTLRFVDNRIVTAIFQMRDPATRFGALYREEIAKARNVTAFVYANVVNIETDDMVRTVTRLHVACLQGNRFAVAAKYFILATGAIENARLLLSSDRVRKVGLGNQHDLVGRFFMSHALSKPGLFLPSDPLIPATLYLYDKPAVETLRVVGHLTLSPETQRRHKLLNFNASLKFAVSAAQKGVVSLKRLMRREFDTFARDLKNIITDMDGVATAAYWKLFKGAVPVEAFPLTCAIEQCPNPDSRVTLSSRRDALGMQRVRLDWRLSPMDKHSLRRSLEILGMEFGRAGLGRLKIDLEDTDDAWTALISDGGHHIGTTRMHANPKQGVVDENCQVHEMSNLFVAGSSVFPTSGHANPTLTIVALALKLAAHVKRIME